MACKNECFLTIFVKWIPILNRFIKQIHSRPLTSCFNACQAVFSVFGSIFGPVFRLNFGFFRLTESKNRSLRFSVNLLPKNRKPKNRSLRFSGRLTETENRKFRLTDNTGVKSIQETLEGQKDETWSLTRNLKTFFHQNSS